MKNTTTEMVSADYILFHCQEQSRSYKPPANADGNTKANSSLCQGIAMQFKPTNVSEKMLATVSLITCNRGHLELLFSFRSCVTK